LVTFLSPPLKGSDLALCKAGALAYFMTDLLPR
jgi:hypothetical protein